MAGDGAKVRIRKLGFECYRSCKIKLNFLLFSFKDIFAYDTKALHQDGRVVKALDLRSNGRIVRVGSSPTPGNSFFIIMLQPKYESLIQTYLFVGSYFDIVRPICLNSSVHMGYGFFE